MGKGGEMNIRSGLGYKTKTELKRFIITLNKRLRDIEIQQREIISLRAEIDTLHIRINNIEEILQGREKKLEVKTK